MPQDITFNGTYPLDHFIDDSYYTPNYYQGPAGGGIGGNFDGQHRDAPLFYFTTTYSLYSANNLFDRSTDQLITSVSYPPYDDTSADLRLHGCGSGQVYNPIWDGASTPNAYYNPSGIVPGQGCVPRPPCSLQWCQISLPAGLAPGTYRLVVETTGLNASTSAYTSTSTDGWGSHAYSVKVCDGTGLSTPVSCSAGTGQSHGAGQYNDPGVSVYGWNNMDIIVQQPLSQQTPNSQYPQTSCISSNATPYACVDLACLSSAYAGRTFTIELYDPGDGTGSGNLYIGIVPPPGLNATIAYPSYATTTTIDGDTVVQTAQSSYRPFNGLWLSATVSIPSSYSGDCFDANTGWWQLVYAGSSSMQPTDVLAVQATLVGSPVHLV